METFSQEVRMAMFDVQNGYCAHEGCYNKITSFHHKLPNYKRYQKKFPLFLNSPFNCVGLCQECHDQYPHLYRVTDKLAEVYERFLEGDL